MDQLLRKHLWVINLVSLAMAAFFLATGTGALISLLFVTEPADDSLRPVARRSPQAARDREPRFVKRDGRDICVKNIFNYKNRPCAEELVVEPDVPEEGDDEEPTGGVPEYCSGDSKLVATMASSDADWAFAMIKSEGKTMPFRIGDKVPDLGMIKRVGWRLVLIDPDSGADCLLDLYPVAEGETKTARASRATPTPTRRSSRSRRRRGRLSPELQKQIEEGIDVVSATERNIDRGLVDSLIENSSALMSQARILPYEREGQVQGFKLYGIRRNSLLGKLGLRNGDIVNSIGGIEMSSPDRALEAYTKLRSADDIVIDFTRRGRRQSMDYNIR